LETRKIQLIGQVTDGSLGDFKSGLSKTQHSPATVAQDLIKNAFQKLPEDASSEQILGTFGVILRKFYPEIPPKDILLPLRHVQASIEEQKAMAGQGRAVTPEMVSGDLKELRAGLQKILHDTTTDRKGKKIAPSPLFSTAHLLSDLRQAIPCKWLAEKNPSIS
jgi:hypothetical protein